MAEGKSSFPLRWAPRLTLLLLLFPIAAGLLGTVLPAFGYLPVLGGEEIGLAPWRRLVHWPGVWRAAELSLFSGLAATAISITTVILFTAAWHGQPAFRRFQRLLSPLLSVPHVTVALGMLFLLSPSGWLFRIISPWLTGWQRPPDLLSVQDGWGISLTAALVVKEIPYLFLMMLAALNHVPAVHLRVVARSLGYAPAAAWLKGVLPGLYSHLRLPVLAVLVFSTSVVDVSLILGPTRPPTLSVMVMSWFSDPDLSMRFMASAGALLQFALSAMAVLLWLGMERLLARAGRWWIASGRRRFAEKPVRWLSAAAVLASTVLAMGGFLSMAMWSFARSWRFPDLLPARWTADAWIRYGNAGNWVFLNSVGIGLITALIATILTIACLEYEFRHPRRGGYNGLYVLYLPLLVPQIAFLFGAQVLFVLLALDGSWAAVIWMHLVFVLPYVFLSLAEAWRRQDRRYSLTAATLGAPPWRVFWRIRLPMMLRPVLIALAVGFAVSMGQYLATVFAGAGRVPTLTTEAVSLSAGGNRRTIGVYALLQAVLPFIVFALAQIVPAVLYRRRRAMQISR